MFSAVLLIPCLLSPGLSLRIPLLQAALVLCYFAYNCLLLAFSAKAPAPHYTAAMLAPLVFFFPFIAKPGIRKLSFFFSGLVTIACFYSFLQVSRGLERPYSFFGNPIFFGEFLLALVPLCAVSVLIGDSKSRIFHSVALGAAAAGIFLCGSRGVWTAFIISVLFLMIFLYSHPVFSLKKLFLPAILASIFTLIVLSAPDAAGIASENIKRATQVFSGNNYTQALTARSLMLKAALPLIVSSPVTGSGPGSYKYFYQKYQSVLLEKDTGQHFLNTSYVHNDYLQITAETGAAGLLLFLGAVFSVLIYADRRKNAVNGPAYLYIAALFSSAASFLTESFFNFPLFTLPSAIIFWYLLGLLAFVSLPAESGLPAVPTKLKNLFALLLLSLPAAAIALNPPGFTANFMLRHALMLDEKNEPSNVDYFKRAISLSKNNYYAHFFLAGSYAKSLRFDDSVRSYEDALSVYPYSSDAYFNIGLAHYSVSEFEKAIIALRQAVGLHPRFVQARLLLARCYIATGHDSLASLEITEAQKADPEFVKRDYEKQLRLIAEETSTLLPGERH